MKIKVGDLHGVKELEDLAQQFSVKLDIDAYGGTEKRTPISYAAELGHLNTCQYLNLGQQQK